CLVTFAQTSTHTPHVIHFDNSYAICRFFSGICAPGPRSYVPSLATPAFIRSTSSNTLLPSTCKPRITCTVLIASTLFVCSHLSMIGVQDCLDLPLITIEHAPQTSSKQFISQMTGVVFSPLLLIGLRLISIKQAMTFKFSL